ncbi:MAG: hypothetical protein KQH79_02020 [Bacteroidetes bacterium]|nr:hypothetical protein [Bacteroidota bacterium]
MKKYILLTLVIGVFACTTQKSVTNYTTLSQNEFLSSPFGFDENIENFSNLEKPKFQTQKLLRKNKHYVEKTDTIYKFSYKKSEIFFYKTHRGKEFLLAGKILNKQIKLINGISVGMHKDEFNNRFSDQLNFNSDSIQMIGEGTKYTFIFANDKLQRINIDNYFD